MPLIWANENARNAHLTRENAKAWEERHQDAVQAPADLAGADGPARPVQAATGQPGVAGAGSQGHAGHAVPGGAGNADPIDQSILGCQDADMAGALAFSEASRKGRSRVRGRAGIDQHSHSPDSSTTNYLIPRTEIDEIAETCCQISNPKDGWRLLLTFLRRKGLTAKQADELRPVIWARRAEMLSEQKRAARAARKELHRQKNGKADQAAS